MSRWDRLKEDQMEGVRPGIGSGGGESDSKQGLRGRNASAFARKWGAPLDGLKYECIPPGLREFFTCFDAIEGFSRIAERTFRNFQLAARRPSHIDPPFISYNIHGFGPIAVNNAIAVGYTNLFSFTVPNGMRGVITQLGQRLDSESLFDSMSWRIQVGGRVIDPYSDIRTHLWNDPGPTTLAQPIKLRSGETFLYQAARIAAGVAVRVNFQACGWFWPVRAETGDNIKSTITD